MRTLFRTIGTILFVWMFIQLTYQTGYKKTTDADFDVNLPELKAVPNKVDTTRFIKKDTSKYVGNWVDPN